MVASKETAEEQLLRLIEGPEGAAPPAPPSEPSGGASAAQGGASRDPFRLLRSSVAGGAAGVRRLLLREWSRSQGDSFLWNLRLASRILWVVLALLGGYLLVQVLLLRPVFRLASSGTKMAGQAGPPADGSPAAGPLRPLAEYVGAVIQRDPFTGSAAQMLQPAIKTTQRRLEEMAEGLAVVGIDRGANPAALIEDKGAGRTTVVGKGDSINGMKVKEITQEGVLLEYEGEEFLLR